MRPITWLTIDNKTYVSSSKRNGNDTAIPDRPGEHYAFSREKWEWEVEYEYPYPKDLTITEVEAVYKEKEKGNPLAAIILKWAEVE